MTDPSSLSWSNHYDLAYSGVQKSLSQEQGKSISGSPENETGSRQLDSRNQQIMSFHQTAEQRQGDPEVQQQSGWDHMHDYKRESSLQQFSPPTAAINEGKQVTWEDIMQVKHFVETCIKSYMTKNEIIQALSTHAKIDPCFTQLVWQRLEKENQDFFRKYYIWLKIKEQILLFNHLLEQQHQLMVMESALDFRQPQLQTNMQRHFVSSEHATQFTHQSALSSHGCFGADSKVQSVMEVPTSRKSSLFDTSSTSNMNFNQDPAMVRTEGFFCNPTTLMGRPSRACNMIDPNEDGFLHMGSLEGMQGSLGQSSMNRCVEDLSTMFQTNQGSFSGPSFLSSSMNAFMSTSFQNTGEGRHSGPITEHIYDSYGDKGLEDYGHMVQGRQ
uniref:Angiotensin-converting enzyme 2 n=1 Tax=Araucaria cunninghamii TaxID=56994 RepID=A0A0D6R3J5_ARACU